PDTRTRDAGESFAKTGLVDKGRRFVRLLTDLWVSFGLEGWGARWCLCCVGGPAPLSNHVRPKRFTLRLLPAPATPTAWRVVQVRFPLGAAAYRLDLGSPTRRKWSGGLPRRAGCGVEGAQSFGLVT